MRIIYKILIVSILITPFYFSSALTKPGPDADIDNLSYVFYLFYDNGQLFADRDYEVKFDVLEEAYSPELPDEAIAYIGEIVNFKQEVVKTFRFDPRRGDPDFKVGKITVRAPYVSDALSARFYDNQGRQLVTMFVTIASICNDDDFCDSVAGENEKTCSNDCKKIRPTPIPITPEVTSGFLGDFDMITIGIYAVSGLGVIVLAWFGWKWWKKKREESFLPPPSSSSMPSTPKPPIPPIDSNLPRL